MAKLSAINKNNRRIKLSDKFYSKRMKLKKNVRNKKLSFKKILVTGLPGSGKSTLSEKLALKLDAIWLNADKVRGEVNDWDFSYEGRLRQTKRMKLLADDVIKNNKNVIADFVCPTPETRKDFCPDITIWVDTIKKGKFEDTQKFWKVMISGESRTYENLGGTEELRKNMKIKKSGHLNTWGVPGNSGKS